MLILLLLRYYYYYYESLILFYSFLIIIVIISIVVGVGSRHLPLGAILQERYLRGCNQCCRLSDSQCPLFPVPLLSHLHKWAAVACPLKTTSTNIYITLLHLTHLHPSTQFSTVFFTESGNKRDLYHVYVFSLGQYRFNVKKYI